MDSNVRIRSDIRSDLSYLSKTVKIDTSRTAYFANGTQSIVIEENIIATEYDKESGKPIKETKTKRKVIQDSDKVVAKEEQRRVEIQSQDSLNHIADVSKKIESETNEEVIGGQKSFGKWFGIILGLAIVFLIIYICKKLRVN